MDTLELKRQAEALASELIAWRRHFHRHPELSWQEEKTTLFIEEKLRAWGFENIRRGFGGGETGLTAELNPDKTPCVALRSDIDALPVTEQTDLEWGSEAPGLMHACGHDAHMACLLGAARLLSALKDQVPGRVRLLFQPGEETMMRSGAIAMIEAGALEGVSAIGGLHVAPFVPAGRVEWRDGPQMASGGTWTLTFTGKGAHGAMPQAGVDPTIPAAAYILALQTLVSRETHPASPNVISVGTIRAGEAPNIIPDTATLRGTFRTFDREPRKILPGRMDALARSLAAAWRCEADFALDPGGTTVVDNDPALGALLAPCAEAIMGKENVGRADLQMISEDFSFFQERVPGLFFFLGVGTPDKKWPLHSPRFDLDEACLSKGAALLACFALNVLRKKN